MSQYQLDLNNIRITTQGSDVMALAVRRLRDYFPSAYHKILLLVLIITTDKRIGKYGATDGKNLFLNPNGLAKLMLTSDPVGYLAFLLLHECLHCLLFHPTRLLGLAIHKRANIAADYCINGIIEVVNRKVMKDEGFIPFPLIANVYLDEELSSDRTAHQVYDILTRKAELEEEQEQQPEPQDTNPGAPSPDPGDEEEEGETPDPGNPETGSDDSDTDDGDDEAGDDGDDTAGGGAPDGDEEDTDEDTEGDGSGADAGDGDEEDGDDGPPDASDFEGMTDDEILSDFVGGAGDDGDLEEPELDEGETLEDRMKEEEEQAEQIAQNEAMNKQAGLGGDSAGVDLTHAQTQSSGVTWLDHIKDWVVSHQRDEFTAPINIDYYSIHESVVPGRGSDGMGGILVLIDVSYSVTRKMVAAMLTGMDELLVEAEPSEMIVVPFQSKVNVDDILYLEPGDYVPRQLNIGGGTSFARAFEWANANAADVEGIILFTDGMDSWDGVTPPACPVVAADYGHNPGAYPNWVTVVDTTFAS